MAILEGSQTGVGFMRSEVRRLLVQYDLIRDCMAGSHVIKAAREKYLPRPNAADTSNDNKKRYLAYIVRAVFYNVVRRTIYGMVGQIFMRDPQIVTPTTPVFTAMLLDADGEGVSIEQKMSETSYLTLEYGRSGILTNYVNKVEQRTPAGAVDPNVPEITVAELAEGDVRPTFSVYESRQIVNWRKAVRGSRKVYTLIVLSNMFPTYTQFEIKEEQEFIVLKLLTKAEADAEFALSVPSDPYNFAEVSTWAVNSDTTDVYKIEIWRKSGAAGFSYVQRYFPTDSTGKFINEIPFQFVGVEKNDGTCPEPPIYDMAEINVAHYRNSADYEEMLFVAGQPTIVASGVTMEWAKEFLKGGFALGSRGGIPLPVGGQAQLLQAQPNSTPMEGMIAKEKQMVSLGAKLIEQRSVARTATEATIESTADATILGTIAKNVGMAWQNSLKTACKFTGDDPTDITVKLNTEFDLTKMDPADRFELLTEMLNGGITFSEYRANLRRGGIATEDDITARAQIAAESKQRSADAVAQATAMAQAMPPKPPVAPTQPGGGTNPSQSAGNTKK